jgi:hypothetical protein
MLRRNGRILFTTPNPWYINVIVKNIIGQTPFTDNVDHIAWFDPSTLMELGSKFDLRLEKFSGVMVSGANSLQGQAFFSVAPNLIKLGLQPMLFSKTIVYEFVHSPG